MTTRQAKSIARIRRARTKSGRCRDCGSQTTSYRCAVCATARRAAHRIYMQHWRKAQ